MTQIPYWEDNHLVLMKNATNYEALSLIALDIFKNMPSPICQVCGPISSGGEGSIEENLKIFKKTISRLVKEGHTIFDQTYFEKPMSIIRSTYDCSEEERNDILLNEFYKPVFESGFVKKTFFMHGWESSQGARWEHNLIIKLGIEKIYLPQDFFRD